MTVSVKTKQSPIEAATIETADGNRVVASLGEQSALVTVAWEEHSLGVVVDPNELRQWCNYVLEMLG